MAQVSLSINNKTYLVACDDGQESHLATLGAMIDAHVRNLGGVDSSIGETRIMLMAALMLADELTEARGKAAESANAERVQAEAVERADSRAVAALEAAARKIESLLAR
jgi:cell division protein ZapA